MSDIKSLGESACEAIEELAKHLARLHDAVRLLQHVRHAPMYVLDGMKIKEAPTRRAADEER